MGVKKLESIINDNCDDIMIYHFDKIRQTKDLKWMVEGYTGREVVELPENIVDRYDDLMNEFCIKTNNNKNLDYCELEVEVSHLNEDYSICKALLGTLLTSVSEDVFKVTIEELRHRNLLLNESKPFKKEFDRLERQLRQRKTKLERKQGELSKYNVETGEGISIQRTKVKILKILGIQSIDLRTTSVTEWIELNNEAIEVSKHKK